MTPPTISVTAAGRREALPEQATIEAVAIGTGASAEAALASAQDCEATIRGTIDAVPADQVRTVELQVENTDEMFDPVTEAAYEATASMEVRCAPQRVEAAVVEVADAGGRVRNVEFELSEERYRTLQEEALTAATDRAREKAERIATAEGLTITGVREVSTTGTTPGETSSIGENSSLVEAALADSSDTGLQPSPIEVVEAVEAVYDVAER
jgi:uncharacterized protein YggE